MLRKAHVPTHGYYALPRHNSYALFCRACTRHADIRLPLQVYDTYSYARAFALMLRYAIFRLPPRCLR